jgi:hypothetical protein
MFRQSSTEKRKVGVAGRIDDEHPPHPRVQEEVAMTQIKGTNLEA